MTQKHKPFRITVDLEKLVRDGKARIEPQEKVDAFSKRRSDYMKPIYREFKKKQYQSEQDAKRIYLTD